MSTVRKRLSSDQSRAAAVEAARALLIEAGPHAVTLAAVAKRIGRTHANVLHHFGSAAGLQAALAKSVAEGVTAAIGAAVRKSRAGEIDRRVIVDMTFDAFDSGGAGALASWAILSGERAALDPILAAIHRLVEEIGPESNEPLAEITLTLVLIALGDALMGRGMSEALGLPRQTAREMAYQRLITPAPVGADRAPG